MCLLRLVAKKCSPTCLQHLLPAAFGTVTRAYAIAHINETEMEKGLILFTGPSIINDYGDDLSETSWYHHCKHARLLEQRSMKNARSYARFELLIQTMCEAVLTTSGSIRTKGFTSAFFPSNQPFRKI